MVTKQNRVSAIAILAKIKVALKSKKSDQTLILIKNEVLETLPQDSYTKIL